MKRKFRLKQNFLEPDLFELRKSLTSSKKQNCKRIPSLLSILYCRKNVTFLNEGTFTLTSSVQEVKVIFELNKFKNLGKA